MKWFNLEKLLVKQVKWESLIFSDRPSQERQRDRSESRRGQRPFGRPHNNWRDLCSPSHPGRGEWYLWSHLKKEPSPAGAPSTPWILLLTLTRSCHLSIPSLHCFVMENCHRKFRETLENFFYRSVHPQTRAPTEDLRQFLSQCNSLLFLALKAPN